MRLLILTALGAAVLAAQPAENLDFLGGLNEYREIRNMLPAYLNRKAFALLDERERRITGLTSPVAVAEHRAYVRARMLRALGGLPERTPLNARVTGVLERRGYRVEKVIFESLPGFYVTGNLYLPASGAGPFPAVLYPLGHEAGAKSYPLWQTMLITLARTGYVALAWDPIGQGERLQFYDPDWKDSKLRGSTTEHSMLGAQCLLVGDSVARYTIWDGIRALDYLLSRKEVDAKRVAVTGNSGGGTHSAYLAALDDRIQVAAPSCYITSWRRLLETIGPQDAEQNLPPFLADGLDHADFIYAVAPKPYLMLSAIRDFFSIGGARETFTEATRVYAALGAGEKMAMVEADDGHGYSKPRRLAAYRWLSRWLKGAEDASGEGEVEIETEEDLWATETGQVATALGGETVFTLNRQRLAAKRPAAAAPAEVRRLAAYAPRTAPLKVQSFGRMERDGYGIEKLAFESEPGIVVPALLYRAAGTAGRAPGLVYVHGRGKSADRDAEQFAKAGLVVLAMDARGMGETAIAAPPGGGAYQGYFGDYSSAMKAFLMGRTLVGMRAEDVTRAVDLLVARPEVDPQRIYALGKEAAAPAVLHAAALDPRIRKVALEGMLLSYQSVVEQRIHRGVFESVVPGALQHYDLPELAASLEPRPVWVVDAVDPLGRRLTPAQMKPHYRNVKQRRAEDQAVAVYREMLGDGR